MEQVFQKASGKKKKKIVNTTQAVVVTPLSPALLKQRKVDL